MRERIEGDVDLAIGGPGGRLRGGENHFQPAGLDALGREQIGVSLPHAGIGEGSGVEHQPRAGHGLEDGRPDLDHLVIDPHGTAEMAEGDMTLAQGWQGRDLG